MKHLTEQEYQVLMANSRQALATDNSDEPEDEPESKLQSDIKAHCKQKGWPYLSFPQTPAVKKFLPPGWPDMTIKLPKSRTLDLEIKKTKVGRLSDKQKLMKAMFVYLGHEIHKVDSWKGFLGLVEKVGQC